VAIATAGDWILFSAFNLTGGEAGNMAFTSLLFDDDIECLITLVPCLGNSAKRCELTRRNAWFLAE